jgi:hypothetical protein
MRIATTSTHPRRSAIRRLDSDISMNVAGRKMVESISTSARPGFIASSASSTPSVTSNVFPHGCFSTILRVPGPSLMTASPIICACPSTTSATSPIVRTLPPRTATGTDVKGRGSRVDDLSEGRLVRAQANRIHQCLKRFPDAVDWPPIGLPIDYLPSSRLTARRSHARTRNS